MKSTQNKPAARQNITTEHNIQNRYQWNDAETLNKPINTEEEEEKEEEIKQMKWTNKQKTKSFLAEQNFEKNQTRFIY